MAVFESQWLSGSGRVAVFEWQWSSVMVVYVSGRSHKCFMKIPYVEPVHLTCRQIKHNIWMFQLPRGGAAVQSETWVRG